jgi:hypothetical protein
MEGYSITEAEAKVLVIGLSVSAVPVPELEFTPSNWEMLFGSNEIVTPLCKVKMGENQYAKMMKFGREWQLGMVYPTLTDPDLVIEVPSAAMAGVKAERPSSFVYMKLFSRKGKTSYFESVTIMMEGYEIVISNHMADLRGVVKCIGKGQVVFLKETPTSISSDGCSH